MFKKIFFSLILLPISLASLEVLSPSFQQVQTEKAVLENGMQIYLVSDPLAEKSAAALSVNTGSWENPPNHMGLAHFLEHMLFMGTKKYPIESSYAKFIEQHGGRTNAFTSGNYTTYLFDINTPSFEEALDRFSQFFKEPLLSSSAVKREKNAVAQEHAGNLDNDQLRRYAVGQALGNQKHPENLFQTGNLDTLKKTTTVMLRKWFHTHYSANLMTLVIVSPLPIETLKEWINQEFGTIKNREKAPLFTSETIMQPSMFRKITYIKPAHDIQTLTLSWELPSKFTAMTQVKPADVVAYVLGHEGKGSLLAQLKQEGLAESLAAGGVGWKGHSTIFYLQLELTSKGSRNLFKVIERCFQAIQSLKKMGISQDLYQEIYTLSKLKFQYPHRKDPFDEVKEHSIHLQEIPLEQYPEAKEIPLEYDPEAYQKLLTYLSPEHVFIDFMASPEISRVAPDSQEKWYGVEYAVKPIPEKTLHRWNHLELHPNIQLPEKNQWVPEELSLKSQEEKREFPFIKKLYNNDYGVLYFAQDQLYLTPKNLLKLRIKSPKIALSNAKSIVFADLYAEALKDTINTVSYGAKMAGAELKIEREEDTLAITLIGYSDKSGELLEAIVSPLKGFDIGKDKFSIFKTTLSRKYKNAQNESPYKLAIEAFREILYQSYPSNKDKLQAINEITYDQFVEFTEAAWQKRYLEGIFYGNMTESDAEELWGSLQKIIAGNAYAKEEQPQQAVAGFPKSKGPFYIELKARSRGNAMVLGIEQPEFSYKRMAVQEVLSKAIGKAYFDELRTKQQTGYIIGQLSEAVRETLLNLFIIESHSHDPMDLLTRTSLMIENFLHEIPKEDLFTAIRNDLYSVESAPPENLKEMNKALSELAFQREGHFEWRDHYLQALKDLSYEDFLEITRSILDQENRQKLAVLIQGTLPENERVRYTKAKNVKWLREQSQYSN